MRTHFEEFRVSLNFWKNYRIHTQWKFTNNISKRFYSSEITLQIENMKRKLNFGKRYTIVFKHLDMLQQ